MRQAGVDQNEECKRIDPANQSRTRRSGERGYDAPAHDTSLTISWSQECWHTFYGTWDTVWVEDQTQYVAYSYSWGVGR